MNNFFQYFLKCKLVPVAIAALLALFILQGCSPSIPDSAEAKLRFEWFKQHQALEAATHGRGAWVIDLLPVRKSG